MFTGIIEALGRVVAAQSEGTNRRFTVHAPFASELKVDQSVAHNGVCLTVVAIDTTASTYEVVAIDETLRRTNLGLWQPGTLVNLERCLIPGARLDGHFVQGHVDCTAILRRLVTLDGSWELHFALPPGTAHLVVEKGSICINGISLTVVEAPADGFSVAIIPYTWQHTNLHTLVEGQPVNIEFDILGKYVQRSLQLRPQ